MRVAFFASILLLAASSTHISSQTVATDRPFGELETVATFNGPMPTGVTVSHDRRIFVNFPRWGDDVPFTVAELVDGKAVAYPNAEINDWPGRKMANPNAFMDERANQTHFVNVQSVVVDAADRLWVLDTGAPGMQTVVPGGAKLVAIDLATNRVVKTILLPPETAGTNSYMNDVRFDLRVGENGSQGAREIHGTAYITDSTGEGPNAIVVVDLATGKSWRRLNQHSSVVGESGFLLFVEGKPVYQTVPGKPPTPLVIGSDGIAISADGKTLYYCPISSTKLYAVSTDMLRDRTKSEAQVEATVRVVTGKLPSDGLESDASGNVYMGDLVTNSIHRWNPETGLTETLVHDPRLIWPDTMSVADDGYLYVTANQLNRQASMHNGKDERQKPYSLFRIKIDAAPVRLK